MILATVTDEVGENLTPEQSFATAAEYGIHTFEIRQIGGRRFPDFDRETIDRLKISAAKAGVTFSAVSPGLFKSKPGSELFDYHRGELFERTLRMTQELGIGKIIVFGVERGRGDPAAEYALAVETLAEAARRSRAAGAELLVENEPGFWADTSENTLRLLRDTGNVGLNWDPGNLYNAGERDCLPGYALLKKYVRNLHVKDMRFTSGKTECLPAGAGEIDYPGQLAALQSDGYGGCVTVETHCRPLGPAFRASASWLSRLLREITE